MMPDADILAFCDQYVGKLIKEKYGMSDMEAVRSFMISETYQMLLDRETELYKVSPYILFDMWECEKVTGEPRNSVYIRREGIE